MSIAAPDQQHIPPVESDFAARLSDLLSRIAAGRITGLTRLSGGANMESWSIDWAGDDGGARGYVLRRAPSGSGMAADWMAERPFDLACEAALVQAARSGGVTAPEVVAILTPGDGLGHGYVMIRVEAEVSPAAILADPPPHLIDDLARELAAIHALPRAAVPDAIPVMDTAAALAELKARFAAYGGDRPVLALALRWLETHVPPPAPPVLVHGDFRLGNLMVTPGGGGGLAAVLDWELAHWGDAHEDLAYGCMTVWRFGGHDRPAFGLADLDRYWAAYAAASGRVVEAARFRFWLVYRTAWWALGCMQMAAIWRSGVDASLERVVISRRTSEQELDLLLLLEDGRGDRAADTAQAPRHKPNDAPTGEASAPEIIGAVADWLAHDVKARSSGRDRFMVAVAINALGMVRRELETPVDFADTALADALLSGAATIDTPGILARLRQTALAKLGNDVPKYPALAAARALWNDT